MSKDSYVREKRTAVVKREKNISACARMFRQHRERFGELGPIRMSIERETQQCAPVTT